MSKTGKTIDIPKIDKSLPGTPSATEGDVSFLGKKNILSPLLKSNELDKPVKDAESKSAVSKQTGNLSQDAYEAGMQFLQKSMDFLATSSNETLVACVAGLFALTYMILGRVGLFLMGLVGGFLLKAIWEESRGQSAADMDPKKSNTIELSSKSKIHLSEAVFKTILGASELKKDSTLPADNQTMSKDGKKVWKLEDLNLNEDIYNELDKLMKTVVDQYVNYWYGPLIPDDSSFLDMCNSSASSFTASIVSRIIKKRPADLMLQFLTNCTSILAVFLDELCAAVNDSTGSSVEESIEEYLEKWPNSSLAQLTDESQQRKKLMTLSEDILERHLDRSLFNCKITHLFLKQIMSKIILEYTVQNCSNNDFINGWIVYLLEESSFSAIAAEAVEEVEAAVDSSSRSRPTQANGQLLSKSITPKNVESSNSSDRAYDSAFGATKPQGPHTSLSNRGRAESNSSTNILQDGQSTNGSPQKEPSDPEKIFTSFDQILPPKPATGISTLNDSPDNSSTPKSSVPSPPAVLSFYSAGVSILDDTLPGDKTIIKTKPGSDYFLQIEPRGGAFPGWMISRQYSDFEALHEILGRIANISGGCEKFRRAQPSLPNWRGISKSMLLQRLERYLADALATQPLADCEGMKRFLERESAFDRIGQRDRARSTQNSLENVGKNVMGVLNKTQKEVTGGVGAGGRAIIGGIGGVFGAGKRISQSSATTNYSSDFPDKSPSIKRQSMDTDHTEYSRNSYSRPVHASTFSSGDLSNESTKPKSMDSPESLRSVNLQRNSTERPALGRMYTNPWQSGTESDSATDGNSESLPISSNRSNSISTIGSGSTNVQKSAESGQGSTGYNALNSSENPLETLASSSSSLKSATDGRGEPANLVKSPETLSKTNSTEQPRPSGETVNRSVTTAFIPNKPLVDLKPLPVSPKRPDPITESETQAAIELAFALITPLYGLSASTWKLRLTLLGAAKSLMIRPGSAALVSIQNILDSALQPEGWLTSSEMFVSMIRSVHGSVFPEVPIVANKPEESQKLRSRASDLVSGPPLPASLVSVMGIQASREACEKVWEALMNERIARGLIFGLVVQAVQVCVH